jgi:thiopurine S-methyltransferase
MLNQNSSENAEHYWTERYIEQQTGWDVGHPTTPLKTYIDQLENKALKILIPGAGNAYEAEYLFKNGFKNVHVLDISKKPLEHFKKRVPDFPLSQLIHADFFKHQEFYDLILEQTFFCAFPPSKENREQYASKMNQLLNKHGKLAGLWFNFPLSEDIENPPFGGSKEEYLNYFQPYFKIKSFKSCYNSIEPRKGRELFGIFLKNN